MISAVHSSTTPAIETDSIEEQDAALPINKPTRRLFARWEMVDNKLVCKWLSAD